MSDSQSKEMSKLETTGQKPIEQRSLKYWAGILDGEGCFQYRSSPEVNITNSFLPLLFAAKERWGGSVQVHKDTDRVAYRWRVFGEEAIKVCEDLAPHMWEKAYQACLILIMRRMDIKSRAPFQQALKDMKNVGAWNVSSNS